MAVNNIPKEKLDWLIPHQANLRIIEAIAKRLDLPMEKVIVTIDTHGNTSAASVPLGVGHRHPRWPSAARSIAIAGSLWRWLHLGIRPDPLLTSRVAASTTQKNAAEYRGVFAFTSKVRVFTSTLTS